MSLYRCRFLDSTGSFVQTSLAAKDDAEAIEIAQSMGANSAASGPGVVVLRWCTLRGSRRLTRRQPVWPKSVERRSRPNMPYESRLR